LSSQSFEILSSADFFRAFLCQVRDYLDQPLSSVKAVICSLFAWHLAEWVWEEHQGSAGRFEGVDDFKKHLQDKCPSLRLMRDIANGTKHCSITRYTPKVKKAKMQEGSFGLSFDRSFGVARLTVQLQNGQTLPFDHEIREVCLFWHRYFSQDLGKCV